MVRALATATANAYRLHTDLATASLHNFYVSYSRNRAAETEFASDNLAQG